MNVMSGWTRLMMGVTSAAVIVLSPWAAADPWPASTIGPPPKGFEMVKVAGGCYDMGDFLGIGEENEGPKHRVCVKDFLMGKFPLSQTEWIQVMGRNPSAYANCGGTCPVENVSWDDTQEFLRRLNARGGDKYRLATEAEWEYAARSGGKADAWSGTSDVAQLVDYAWYLDNSIYQTHPVGQKKPNALGLYDMSGNVWEWTADWYAEAYDTSSPQQDPTGPSSGKLRVLRGGYWGDIDGMTRTTRRIGLAPGVRGPAYGFRLVRMPPPTEAKAAG
jgi:formylglycine-generating enzyme